MARRNRVSGGAEAAEAATELHLEPKQLFMVMDKQSDNYGVNFRIISIVEGNPDSPEPLEPQVKFQHQIPLKPGTGPRQSTVCPWCEHPFEPGDVLHHSPKKQKDEQNNIRTLPQSKFLELLDGTGASWVEA